MFGGLGLGAPPVPSPPDSQTGGAMTDENEYTTKRGRKLRFIGIQGLLDRFYASHSEPAPPTYEVQALGGRVEYHPLTDVQDRSSLSDDERAQIAEYEKRLLQYNDKTTGEFINLILRRGVDIGIDGDGWAKEQKESFGIDVPDDPDKRKLHYINTEVLYGNPDEVKEDILEIISGVMVASGIDKERVAELQAIFRDKVGLDTAGRIGDKSRALDVQRKVSTGRRGNRKNGKADVMVRRPKRVR